MNKDQTYYNKNRIKIIQKQQQVRAQLKDVREKELIEEKKRILSGNYNKKLSVSYNKKDTYTLSVSFD